MLFLRFNKILFDMIWLVCKKVTSFWGIWRKWWI